MEELTHDIRSRFTDILLVLHVDKQPLEPLRVPSLTRVWNAFDDNDNDMPHKSIPDHLNALKPFVKKYLVENKGMQKSYQKEKNKMSLAVLNLAKCMVTYGFYISEEELIEMIDPLITMLDGSRDLSSQEEEETMKRNGIEDNIDTTQNLEDLTPKLNFARFTSRYDITESNIKVMQCKDKM